MLKRNLDLIEGIVDVGLVVIAHFENPAKTYAVEFLKKVLSREIKAIIPITCFIGAYHIMTNYLRVPRLSAKKALVHTLMTRSPALYEDISIDDAIDAIDIAATYNIESWDGYLVALARNLGTKIIFSIDKKLSRVEEIIVINPIPKDIMKKYHEWLSEKLKSVKS